MSRDRTVSLQLPEPAAAFLVAKLAKLLRADLDALAVVLAMTPKVSPYDADAAAELHANAQTYGDILLALRAAMLFAPEGDENVVILDAFRNERTT